MITRTEKFRLGLFLIASLLLLAGTIAVLVGTRMYQPRDEYKVRFDESVSGLDIGAQVKLSGVRVGQVLEINIDRNDPNVVEVVISLRKGIPIRSDSEAVLRTLGITGLKFIEIHGGTGRAELRKPGEAIKSGQSLLGSLEGKAQDIAVKTEIAVDRIIETMSEKNVRNVEEILVNAKNISGRVDGLLERNSDNIDIIVDEFAKSSRDLREVAASAKRSSERLEQIVKTQQPKIDVIVDNVNETVVAFKNTAKKLERVDDVLSKIDKTLRELNNQIASARVGEIAESTQNALKETAVILKGMRRVMQASRLDVYRSVRSLKKSLGNMEQFSAEIRENPSLLLSGDDPPERETDE